MNQNDLAIERTKLANQRTDLAYMRTGFAITGVAELFKKWWIVFFGVFMLFASTLQYIIINDHLNKNTPINNTMLDIIPFMYVLLGIGLLYLQMNKKSRIF